MLSLGPVVIIRAALSALVERYYILLYKSHARRSRCLVGAFHAEVQQQVNYGDVLYTSFATMRVMRRQGGKAGKG